jgi:AAA+ superfamily predicted ATPase
MALLGSNGGDLTKTDPTSNKSTDTSYGYQGSTRANGPEPEVILDYTPKKPIHMDEVNVTIRSKFGDEITRASLLVTFIKFGESRSGGYQFTMINSTLGYAVIDGTQNQGETDVYFYAIADFDTVEVTTEEYQYRVEYLGTWQSLVFSENINMKFSPTTPEPGETVKVSINSLSQLIPIKYAFLQIQVRFPGVDFEQSGGVNFTRANDTSMYAEITGYPGSTNVTFWVEAYDEALTKTTSPKYYYTVVVPPSEHAPQSLYIYVHDEAKNDLIPNANVSIFNDTWVFYNDENAGIVWSPFALSPGVYTVRVKNGDSEITKTVYIPTADQDFTEVWFRFNIAESKGIILEFEEFPQWYTIAGVVVFILASLLFYYIYVLLKRRGIEEERSMKRRMADERRGLSDRDRPGPVVGGVGGGSEQNKEPNSFWYPGMVIKRMLADESYKVTVFRILGFFLLGLFGATWAPFYPWWMVLVIGIVVAAISYRFSYLSLLVLIVFVIGSTAYQFPAFGWLFMMFALVIAICSLFDWRFSFLVFMTLFVSRLGVAFVVPVLSGLMLSLFIGLAVAITAGIFFTFLVTTSEFTLLSFFVGPSHDYGFITFSKPVVDNFRPTDFTNAFSSLYKVDIDGVTTILQTNFTSMIPFIQIIIWTVLVFLTVYLFQKYSKGNILNATLISLVPSFIIVSTSGISIWFYDQPMTLGIGLMMLGVFGVMFSAMTFAFMNMELFKEFYLGKTKEMPIGTRIGEMLTLRKTGFTQIGGLKEIKREIKDAMIGPLLRPEKAAEYGVEPPRGIMLFGPPGCGKTLLMRAIATELNVEMVGVRCSDVMSKWYGESEGMIEKLFKSVKERRPCILFLDEIDAIAKRRDFYSADDVTPRLLSIMLSELDGMDEAAGVIVVGATNKPELVDPALMRPGRFDKVIFIPAPNYRSRIEIFKIHLKGKPVSSNLDIEHLAHSTDGYSGADIENLVKEAATLTMKRSISSRRRTVITTNDFLKIIPRLKPSLTREMKEEYEKLQADFERKKYGREIQLPGVEEAEFEVEDEEAEEYDDSSKKAKAPDRRRIKQAPRAPPGRRTRPSPSQPPRPRRPAPAAGAIDRGRPRPRPGTRERERDGRSRGRGGGKGLQTTWNNIAGLDHTKDFFKSAIENNLKRGKR